MARVLFWLFVAGPTVGLVAMALAPPEGADERGIVALAGCAYAVAVVVLVVFDRLPMWAFAALVGVGTGLVSGAIYFAGNDASAYALFYLWIGLYSAYFFGVWLLAAQIAVVAAAYGVVLTVVDPPGVPLDQFALTVGSLVVTGTVVALLQQRVIGLVRTLSDAAHTDALTALPNRRGFERALEIELERSRRGDQPFSVLVADVDHFKSVNDRLGHPGGDEALRLIASTLANGKRLIDTVARLGGEEFALIVPGTDSRGGYILAERLRTSLRAAFVSEPVPVTLSVGVAHYPDHGGSVELLLRSADAALYAAKALGRDRCVVYTFELEDTLARMDGREAPGQVGLLLTLSELLDMRKPDTVRHSQIVARYAERAARQLGMPEERVARVRLAGLLHDIGKVGIPDAIVGHPGPLGTDETDEMRGHPEIGARLVEGTRARGSRAVDRRAPRAARRPRLPARAARRRDPRRGVDHLGGRRLCGDDDRPGLPARDRDAGGPRGARAGRGDAVRRTCRARVPRCARPAECGRGRGGALGPAAVVRLSGRRPRRRRTPSRNPRSTR